MADKKPIGVTLSEPFFKALQEKFVEYSNDIEPAETWNGLPYEVDPNQTEDYVLKYEN